MRDEKGRYLLVQEKQQKAYGLWNLAAGHVDEGESFQQAAIREAKEESGYDVRADEELVSQLNRHKTHSLHSFRGEVIGGELTVPKSELLDVRWLTLDEIKQLEKDGKIRDPWVMQSILKAENENTRN